MVSLHGEVHSQHIVENLSQAHVVAIASFSIWAYLVLVSVCGFEAYATGFHSLRLVSCMRTPPNPLDEASAVLFV